MNRWFRHYIGMMRDEKLVAAAVKAKQPVERVVWIWGAILESACEVDDDGRYIFDAGEAAYFLRCDESDVLAVVDALEGIGRIADQVVTRWSERQFQSDTSRERQRRYREKKRHTDTDDGTSDRHSGADKRHGDVTRPSRDGEVTLQESDTDTELNADDSARAISKPMEAEMRAAAGKALNEASPSLLVMADPMRWLAGDCDWSADVIPAITAAAARSRPGRVRSWGYFSDAVWEARDRRLKPAPEPRARGSPKPNGGDVTMTTLMRMRDEAARRANHSGAGDDPAGIHAPAEGGE